MFTFLLALAFGYCIGYVSSPTVFWPAVKDVIRRVSEWRNPHISDTK